MGGGNKTKNANRENMTEKGRNVTENEKERKHDREWERRKRHRESG